MFCKICENFMDITNNVSAINIESQQIGGDNINNLNGIQIESSSSDYDVSMSESGTGTGTITDTNISDILEGSDTDLNIKNFNITDLNKNSIFNKLSNNQKTLVINRILEKIPKNTKSTANNKQSENIANIDSYFYCKSCGYNEKIPEKMFIFSRGDEKKDDLYNYKFYQYKYDNTLPYSKKYNCINEKCPTHTDPKLKMAVFYRKKNSYNIRYICTVCDGYWQTFIEK